MWLLQSKLRRMPKRRKRGPKHIGYQLYLREALAVSDAWKARVMLDSLQNREQDVTGTQV